VRVQISITASLVVFAACIPQCIPQCMPQCRAAFCFISAEDCTATNLHAGGQQRRRFVGFLVSKNGSGQPWGLQLGLQLQRLATRKTARSACRLSPALALSCSP
jgi:hypothetical protein